jgi:DNA-binding Lrp family transcriptional regulator
MTNPSTSPKTIDELDRQILGILAQDPRLPYSEISDRLETAGFELSSEAVRQRVSDLFEITTNFFLVRPDTHEWELVLVTVRTKNESGAKQKTFEAMSDMDYWFVGSGFGTIDIYAVATVDSTRKVDALINSTKNMDSVTDLDYFIETDRATAVERYLQVV